MSEPTNEGSTITTAKQKYFFNYFVVQQYFEQNNFPKEIVTYLIKNFVADFFILNSLRFEYVEVRT